MTDSTPDQDRSVESPERETEHKHDEHETEHKNSKGEAEHKNSEGETEHEPEHLPPIVLAESIRQKSAAINAQSDVLSERLGPEYGHPVELNPNVVMTKLLAATSNLMKAAQKLESER